MSNLVINANSIYDRVIRIGRQTENLVSEITFNVQMWIEEYGQGECVLNVRRNGDGSAYPVPMTIADGMTTWTITDTDTSKKGRGEIQLVYRAGDKVKTSPIFTIRCGESLVGGEVPEPYEEWLSELNRMTAEVEAAKTSTSASAQTAQTAAGTATTKATEAEQSANMASGFANNASASAESASTSAQASAQSAQAASVARTAVESAAISAQAEAEDAEAAKTAAEAAKTAAQTAESNAQGFAQTASEKAAQASESAANAQESVTDAQAEADRAKTYADRAAEVELEIPTKVSELENDAGYLTEHQNLVDYVRKDVLYNMLPVDTASGAVASFPDGADDVPLKSLLVNIEPVQDLHGQDAPYPAGGGKNRYNSAETVWANGFLDDNGSPVSSNASHYTQNFTAVNAERAYILSGSVSSPNVQIRIYFYTANKEWISRTSGTSASTCAFTTPTNCSFIRVQVGTAVTSTSDWQIESGSTATNYAPYSNICPISGWTGMVLNANGTEIPISWESEAGTVYGGTLDVLNGVLTVDRIMQTATECSSVSISSTGMPYADIPILGKSISDAETQSNISSVYKNRTGAAPNDSGWFRIVSTKMFIYDERFIDKTTADAILATEQPVFVYILAAPITYQLTPHEVKSRLGTNNIYADTGDATVEYRADTSAYVAKKIAEAISALS